MSISEYYGSKQAGKTFLEIYSLPLDGSQKVIHRQYSDQQAYDAWHLQLYFQQILDLHNFGDRVAESSLENLPRKEKHLLNWIFINCFRLQSICELGSSLFELIDGLEVTSKYIFSHYGVNEHKSWDSLKYYGVEISKDLAHASRLLHKNYDISISESVAKSFGRLDYLYDQSVSNYAFTNSDEFASYVTNFKYSFLNTYFSFDGTFTSSRLGKELTYFDIVEFMNVLKKDDVQLYHLFGRKAPGPFSGGDLSKGKNVIEGYFLAAKDRGVELKIRDYVSRFPEVKNYFNDKEIACVDVNTYL